MEPITDQNIRQLVRDYLANPSGFPPIGSWNVSNVTDMSNMFFDAYNFDESLDSWVVSNVTDMSNMFNGATSFNQPLNNWIVSNVTNMSGMFCDAISFNQPLDSWDVSNVTDMSKMFRGAGKFNQPLNSWNVSNVTNMQQMFYGFSEFDIESEFNQPLDSWNVSNVTNMQQMFQQAFAFNQPLNTWVIRSDTKTGGMFVDTQMEHNRDLWPTEMNSAQSNTVQPIPTTTFTPIFQQPVQPAQTTSSITVEPVKIYNPNSVYCNLLHIPLEDSNLSIQPDDIGHDIIMIEDVKVIDYLNQDPNNIVFYFGNNVALLTDRDNLRRSLNANTLKYACVNVDTAITPRIENVITDTPYLFLNGAGFTTGGLVPLGMIKTILSDITIKAVQIPSTPVGNAVSTTSFQMLGPNPMAVSASHCQAGQDAAIYTMKRMNVPSATVGGRRRTRRRRKTRRTKKSKINKKRYTKRRNRNRMNNTKRI